ncbi:chaplin [Streptomyces sp. ISL-98]|uniref:chaplin n=1 Tax=Streptomyces sp. ISL-98 TaxID=2819192 RepID=UPI001BEC8C8F|nr:chaplin [Streptomyces sp. ISL-98]MBT2505164.1 chaplin [Streptomyces sp. ISL-98]
MSKPRILAAAAFTAIALLGGATSAAAAPWPGDAIVEGVAAHSPGVLSGNMAQVPVHIPVNVCGNTVNVIAALNPAFGNTCVNN